MSSTPQIITGRLAVTYTVNEALAYGAVGPNQGPSIGQITDSQPYSNGASGVAASINLHFEQATTPITLASGASQTFTLSNLTDGLARNFAMTTVRLLIVAVTARTAGDWLTLTPGATHGWTAVVAGTSPSIKIWDIFAVGVAQTDGYAVSSGSNDQFTITNAGSNAITFEIGIAGCAS